MEQCAGSVLPDPRPSSDSQLRTSRSLFLERNIKLSYRSSRSAEPDHAEVVEVDLLRVQEKSGRGGERGRDGRRFQQSHGHVRRCNEPQTNKQTHQTDRFTSFTANCLNTIFCRL